MRARRQKPKSYTVASPHGDSFDVQENGIVRITTQVTIGEQCACGDFREVWTDVETDLTISQLELMLYHAKEQLRKAECLGWKVDSTGNMT